MKLDELAKLAGVSRTTASYVVNGKAKQYRVSDKTIAKVQALIDEHDFKPNAMAAGLRAGKTNTIGLIVPDFENASYAKIADRLEKSCREHSYQLLITCSNDNVENEIECAKHLLQRQVDALLVSTILSEAESFYQQKNINTPIIGFDRYIHSAEVENIQTDDEGDAYRLAKELVDHQAPKSILFLGAIPELATSRQREKGFARVVENTDIQVEYLYSPEFRKDTAQRVFEQWLTNHPMPEAVFTTSLTLLQGLLNALLKLQRTIPPELMIATFGEHELLDVLPNKIVCSVQNHAKVVESLLDLTLHKIRVKRLAKPIDVVNRQIEYHNWQ
ncbi:catabolite repressor/activator [Pasteurellaceae bacterium LIM206]|nr:catabolite repressor/activator [Pasteurellaceae bacterium LIM206]